MLLKRWEFPKPRCDKRPHRLILIRRVMRLQSLGSTLFFFPCHDLLVSLELWSSGLGDILTESVDNSAGLTAC